MSEVTRDSKGMPTIHLAEGESMEQAATNPEVREAIAGVVRQAQGPLQLGDPQPEGYQLSDEVREVAQRIIASDTRFEACETIAIGYALLWGKAPEGQGGIHLLARAVKAPALWRDLGIFEVVVWANQQAWERLSAKAREALIAHELNHIGGRTEAGNVFLLEHDIEEFAWVVRQYGQWHSGLEHFAEQLGLGLASKAPAP